jgi:iron complex transport system substrate-binding protein
MLDTAEIVRSLNAEEKIVGVTDAGYKGIEVFYPELSELPSLGSSGSRLDYEAVLNLNPDIFLPFYLPSSELKEKLPGVTIIYLGLRFPEHFVEGIGKLGYILDREEEAEEFINWHEGWTDKIKSRTEGLSEDEKPRVYMEVGGLKSTYMTTSGFSRFQGTCDIAGGKSISEDLTTSIWPRVDPEWVIEQNPDIIIKTPWGYSVGGYDMDDPSVLREIREEVLNRPELANVNAVKNRNVYLMTIGIDGDGTGFLIGTAYFAKWIHPELFDDLDPQAIHQEYLDRFQRIDFDLDEHGVFVYPKEPVR